MALPVYRPRARCAALAARCAGLRRQIAPVVMLMAVACTGLTDVEAPDLVQPVALDNPSGALARRAGAIARFATAFADQVINSGVIADEFTDVGDVWPADRRTLTPENTTYPFATLSLARVDAQRAIDALKHYNPTPPARIGELYALAGYVNVMFVENLCVPVPVATVENGIPVAAPPRARDALITDALAMFDSAARYSTAADSMRHLAAVGRARAELLRGDMNAAAAAVAGVPTTFRYELPFSASISTQVNRIYQVVTVNRTLSVADREGGNGLPFVSGTDARVGAQRIGASRNGLPLYNYARNSGLGAPITLASGIEASLVRAEAMLRGGDIAEWAATLNGLRQTAIAPALPPLSADSTTNASADLRVDVTFKERAFWLFATGHRQGDLRRLIRQYGRSAESVFPTGAYPTQGLRYGTDVTFVLRGEDPNPFFNGCEDRGA